MNNENERMSEILNILKSEYPDVKIQLDFTTPFELLVATILSAQCTDARVNIVTKELFKFANTAEEFNNIPLEQLERLIFSTGFYKAKAKNIKSMSKIIIEKFDSEVPHSLEDLIKLPGVGRKTANVMLGHCFNIPAIVVDTHVIRISNLLGFVNTDDAVKIEFRLMELIPENLWVEFTHYFINHGRKICVARKPKCFECRINHLCPSCKF